MAVTINGTTGIDAGASLEADAITLAGANVATQAYADAVTPAALSTASGSAPSYSARAWVNFDGSGTVAIRESGNVSSITDNGTGEYTVNFTTNMPDTSYCCLGTTNGTSGTGVAVVEFAIGGGSVSSISLNTSTSTSGASDKDEIYCAFFR